MIFVEAKPLSFFWLGVLKNDFLKRVLKKADIRTAEAETSPPNRALV